MKERFLHGGTEYFRRRRKISSEPACAPESSHPDVGMFVACNPNNPTGTAIRTEEMREILAHCKKIGASVMIDETYIEFSDIRPKSAPFLW